MRTLETAVELHNPRRGRNTALGIYVVLSTFIITAYALIQYFSI